MTSLRCRFARYECFCGGIGENSRTIREAVLEAMEWIGIASTSSEALDCCEPRLRNGRASAPPPAVIANGPPRRLVAVGCLAALSAIGPTCARNTFSCARVSVSMAGCNDSLHRFDFIRQFAHGPADRSHAPELDDLDLAVYRVRHRTEKVVNRNLMSSLFHDLSPGGVERVLASVKLPFGRTHDLSLRNRTMAMRGLEPSRSKSPPQPESARGPSPNQSCQSYAGRTGAEQARSSWRNRGSHLSTRW